MGVPWDSAATLHTPGFAAVQGSLLDCISLWCSLDNEQRSRSRIRTKQGVIRPGAGGELTPYEISTLAILYPAEQNGAAGRSPLASPWGDLSGAAGAG